MKTNKREFYQHDVPPGLGADEIEFFVMNGEVQFIQGDQIHLFDEITIDIAIRLRNELDSDPDASKGIDLLGITEPFDQLRKFAFCKYGELNVIADFKKDRSNPEYWDCGYRPCPADGIICKFPMVTNGHLTKHDMSVMREISHDLPNKIIADHLHNSIETINKECNMIAGKIGCHTQKGISNFAGANHIN